MRADRRSQVKLDDPAQVLVDAGLIDTAYVAAQLGVTFDSRLEAARAVVRAGDVSPHPLFESQWVGRRRSWQRSGQHPVVWYVSERRRRNRLAPHPLVDPRVIFAVLPRGPAARLRRAVLLALGLGAHDSAAHPDPAAQGHLGDLPPGRDRGGDRLARGGRDRATPAGPADRHAPRRRDVARRHGRHVRPGRRTDRAPERGVPAGADGARLAPGRRRPRLGRRHRRRPARLGRLRRPHHRGPRGAVRSGTRPQRRPRARHLRARRLPAPRPGVEPGPCSPGSSPRRTRPAPPSSWPAAGRWPATASSC